MSQSRSTLSVVKSVAAAVFVTALALTSVEAWCRPLGSLRCSDRNHFQQCALVCLMCKFIRRFDVFFNKPVYIYIHVQFVE